jgi:hypothetical protein
MLNQPGVQLAADTSDPFTGNYPSSKYHYAYEVFGNNGTTSLSGLTNSTSNTSLSDLANASTILNDMMEPYTGNNQEFVGSDHLPIVADFIVTLIPGDFDNNGAVDAADYDVWRAHFGQTAGSGAGVGANAAVPEPATLAMLILAAANIPTWRRRVT